MYHLSDGLRVLLAHPGGPFFIHKDDSYWTLPKGEVDPGEDYLECAKREFEEETGLMPKGDFIPLGSIKQKGGKIVRAWAFPGTWPSGRIPRSNTFQIEWPPRSGKTQSFPEVDRAEMFTVTEAKTKICPTQILLIDRLIGILGCDC